jgi:hypothetical protein
MNQEGRKTEEDGPKEFHNETKCIPISVVRGLHRFPSIWFFKSEKGEMRKHEPESFLCSCFNVSLRKLNMTAAPSVRDREMYLGKR